jgi:hypothetical protein
MLNGFDFGVYRGHSQHTEVLTPLIENHLTPKSIDKSHITALVLLMLVLLQMAIPMPAIANGYSVDVLRVYAHSRIIDYKEFKCFDRIVIMESQYNYLARNGSHMGIGQMKSKYYQSKDPFTQIDLTIKYVHKRYVTMCNALTFHLKHGYY